MPKSHPRDPIYGLEGHEIMQYLADQLESLAWLFREAAKMGTPKDDARKAFKAGVEEGRRNLAETVKHTEGSDFSIIRLDRVCAITGLKRSTIYLLMRRGEFPQSIRVAARAVGWRLGDIKKWVAEKK